MQQPTTHLLGEENAYFTFHPNIQIIQCTNVLLKLLHVLEKHLIHPLRSERHNDVIDVITEKSQN